MRGVSRFGFVSMVGVPRRDRFRAHVRPLQPVQRAVDVCEVRPTVNDEILHLLELYAVIERRPMPSSELVFAKPTCSCAPSLELVMNRDGWTAQVTVADVVSLEFSDDLVDQTDAHDLVWAVVNGASRVIVEGRRRWFVGGDLDAASRHYSWNNWTTTREWCAWHATELSTESYFAVRIA